MRGILQEQLHHQIWVGQTQYSQDIERGTNSPMKKTYRIDDVTAEVLGCLSKKHSMKDEPFLEALITKKYEELKKTNRKIL